MDGGLAVDRSETNRLEIGAILAVIELSHLHEQGDGFRRLEITQGQGDFPSDGRRRIFGMGTGEREDVTAGGAQGAISHQTTRIVLRLQLFADECFTLRAKLRE